MRGGGEGGKVGCTARCALMGKKTFLPRQDETTSCKRKVRGGDPKNLVGENPHALRAGVTLLKREKGPVVMRKVTSLGVKRGKEPQDVMKEKGCEPFTISRARIPGGNNQTNGEE